MDRQLLDACSGIKCSWWSLRFSSPDEKFQFSSSTTCSSGVQEETTILKKFRPWPNSNKCGTMAWKPWQEDHGRRTMAGRPCQENHYRKILTLFQPSFTDFSFCLGLATYWHMCKCCITYLLTLICHCDATVWPMVAWKMDVEKRLMLNFICTICMSMKTLIIWTSEATDCHRFWLKLPSGFTGLDTN